MSKHLKIIQIFVKICHVLSTVAFIGSIIGACGCVIGLVGLGILGFVGNSELVMGFIREEIQLNLDFASTVFSVISGAIWCVSTIIVSYMAMQYFKRELEDGTPFTYDGANQMLRLGIFSAAIPFGTSILEATIYGFFSIINIINTGTFPDVEGAGNFDITLGLAFIAISFLCKYGTELTEKAHQAAPQAQYETAIKQSPQEPEESQDQHE